jgi:phospholipase/carboxylesterase
MADETLGDLVALLPPLLRALEALGFAARHLDPSDVRPVLEALGAPDEAVEAELPRLEAWPENLGAVRAALTEAAEAVIAGFTALRAAAEQPGDLRAVFRALGRAPRAQEALYPLADALPPVSRFFLAPPMRGDAALAAKLAGEPRHEAVGLLHGGGELGARGAWSAYAPEYYTPDEAWPLVVALHGGAGNGRNFLWSWLREARTYGAILIAPTAVGDTWSLSGPDLDTPNLRRILDAAQARWNIDPERLLLTGMSDGGTFCYVSGLEPASPFTHLAPASAAFHSFLAEMADAERMAGLPIHIAHGVRDWMFPVQMAREAQAALAVHGADVTYREIGDLGHTYPRELNPAILAWLRATPPGTVSSGP